MNVVHLGLGAVEVAVAVALTCYLATLSFSARSLWLEGGGGGRVWRLAEHLAIVLILSAVPAGWLWVRIGAGFAR